MNDKQDVEAALIELRAIFPSAACSIEHAYRAGFGTPTPDETDFIKVYECRWTVVVNSMSCGESESLFKAMQQIRKRRAGVYE